MFSRTFSKIFKSSNQQELDKTKNLISAINSQEESVIALSDGDFKEKTLNLKRSIQSGTCSHWQIKSHDRSHRSEILIYVGLIRSSIDWLRN